MKNAGYTRQERSFIALMRILAVVFFCAAILFASSPDYIADYLTSVGNVLLGWNSSPLPPTEGRMWLVMSVSFLVVLSYLCTVVQRNIVRNIGYTRPVIIAALVACLGFVFCFFICDRHFVYFAAAIANGSICVITWRFYHRAQKSRS